MSLALDLSKIQSEPHYAVIFTSQRTQDDGVAYGNAADRMLELAAAQDGFLGVDSVRDAAGLGITVSYWRDLESIRTWHQVAEHRGVQELGRQQWYAGYTVRICRVERSYDFFSHQDTNKTR